MTNAMETINVLGVSRPVQSTVSLSDDVERPMAFTQTYRPDVMTVRLPALTANVDFDVRIGKYIYIYSKESGLTLRHIVRL